MTFKEILFSTEGPIATLTFGCSINSEASRFALSIGKQGFYARVDQADDKAFHFAKYSSL